MYFEAFAMMVPERAVGRLLLAAGFDSSSGEILVWFGIVIGVWYASQRILAALMIRKATSSCPKCFSGQLGRIPNSAWREMFPFVHRRFCHECGERFFRGRKPPFARCPVCNSARLRPTMRVTASWHNAVFAFLGARGYECVRCKVSFADLRPIRSSVQALNDTSPVGISERRAH